MTGLTSAIDYFWETATALNRTDDLAKRSRSFLESDRSFIIPVQTWATSTSKTKHQRGILFQHGTSGKVSSVEIGADHDSLPRSFPVLADDTEYTPCAILMDYDETLKHGILLIWKNGGKSPYSLFVSSLRCVLKGAYDLILELEPVLDPDLLEKALSSGGLRELRLLQTKPFRDRADQFESGEPAEQDLSVMLSLKHSRKRPFMFRAAKDFVMAKARGASDTADGAFQDMIEELGIDGFTYEEAAVVVELLVGDDKRERVFPLERVEPGHALNERIDDTLGNLPERLIKTQDTEPSVVDALFKCLSSVL
jgi:hypothetical protein